VFTFKKFHPVVSSVTDIQSSNFINNGRLVGNLLELTEKDILCCPPPLFHCFGLVCGLLAALSHGSTLVLPSEVFDPTKVLDTLVKEKCTVINAVPTMFQSILDQETLTVNLSSQLSLRTGIIAGASLSRDLLQKINDRLVLNGLIYPFGMTELSAVSLSTTRDISLLSNWTTVGKPLPHTSIKVIDHDGTVLPPGRSGELCVAGYLVHKGYYKAPEKSAELVQIDEKGTAWLHTGDIVSLDSDGTCTVLGRVKDMIKKGKPAIETRLYVKFTYLLQVARILFQRISRRPSRLILRLPTWPSWEFPMPNGERPSLHLCKRSHPQNLR
jgi:acyl-CoA synthetase (AMP-forming)/AMP-acid ligase II